MSTPTPGSQVWLDLAREAAIDPDRPIIDPHHHLWLAGTPGAPWPAGRPAYLLGDLWGDTNSGHRIVKTVFIECRAAVRPGGPDHLKPVGETEFVARIARASRDGGGGAVIAGIVAHADLRGGQYFLKFIVFYCNAELNFTCSPAISSPAFYWL